MTYFWNTKNVKLVRDNKLRLIYEESTLNMENLFIHMGSGPVRTNAVRAQVVSIKDQTRC